MISERLLRFEARRRTASEKLSPGRRSRSRARYASIRSATLREAMVPHTHMLMWHINLPPPSLRGPGRRPSPGPRDHLGDERAEGLIGAGVGRRPPERPQAGARYPLVCHQVPARCLPVHADRLLRRHGGRSVRTKRSGHQVHEGPQWQRLIVGGPGNLPPPPPPPGGPEPPPPVLAGEGGPVGCP